MSIKRRNQLGLSATTFLLLCCAFGIHRTVFILSVTLVIATLVMLGKRFPLLGTFMILVVCNLLNGGRYGWRRW